ncbi:hypothetical protein BGX31_003712 [Mortierella sp. GBA43]|nr:hypothetical protein BGX31_003712 [Mortierella sp. GBA43]
MTLPAAVLSSSSTSHEANSRSYSTILPRRDSELGSPNTVPASDRSAPGSPRRFMMLPPPTTPTTATFASGPASSTAPSSPSTPKTVAATPSTILSIRPSRQTRKNNSSGPGSKSGSGSGSCSAGAATPTARRRTSSNSKLIDQETRDLMRKVSHSAIERRRRERINDKILQLKHLVPACVDEDHLHKLSILQSTIEYIQHLKALLPASVANMKVGRATNSNPNNKTTDMLDAMGGSISAKSPLTPLMTTGLSHLHAKRIKIEKPDIRALLDEYSPSLVSSSSSSDDDAKDGLLLLAGQPSSESSADQTNSRKRVLRKKGCSD